MTEQESCRRAFDAARPGRARRPIRDAEGCDDIFPVRVTINPMALDERVGGVAIRLVEPSVAIRPKPGD